jgi:hypothetical protein
MRGIEREDWSALTILVVPACVLSRSGEALAADAPTEAALDSYAEAIATVRKDGLTRCLRSEVTERFFALCFALEQMRHNLRDLHRCVAEWANSPDQTRTATERTGDRKKKALKLLGSERVEFSATRFAEVTKDVGRAGFEHLPNLGVGKCDRRVGKRVDNPS